MAGCQQSVSTPASLSHTQHRVASVVIAAELVSATREN
jgi:hypothetical protein